MLSNTRINTTKVYKMEFKHKIRGFSNYLFAEGGYVVRIKYVTNHLHHKEDRIISYSKSDDRLTLYDDKGRKQRISKIAIKKRGFIKLDNPVFIPMECNINETPF